MNKRIDLSNLGGFPLTQFTLAEMQESYRGALGAIARLVGDKTILYGVEVVGVNVTNGWIAYNGELIPFIGGTANDKVAITEAAIARTFEDTNIHDAYFTKTATCAALGDFDFADLVAASTIGNLTTGLADLLADFLAHTHTWAAITDKPAGYITYVGTFNVGDITSSDNQRTIDIPDQGGSSYMVSGSLRSAGADGYNDNDVFWMVGSLTATNFKLLLREVSTITQNLRFDYAIIKTL